MAREQLIPMIAKKTRNALNTVPVYVEHFQQIRAGRRCSCFYVEDEASGMCPLCYGSGIVGGYQKRGTKVDVLDVTSPYTVCVNVRPDYGSMTRPVQFALLSTAVRGSIEFTWEPVRNLGTIDDLKLLDSIPDGSTITYSIRNVDDVAWVSLTTAALEQRLAVGKTIRVRVDMQRPNPNSTIPRFIGIRCSYRTHKLSALRCDIPRPTRSHTLEEFGIYSSFTSQQFVFGNDLKSITNSDFFVVLQDGTRWKVTEWQDNKVLNINTSWDITCRLIQDFDRYARVPVGLLDLLPTQFPSDAVRSMQTETEVYSNKGLSHTRLPGLAADVDKAHSTAVGIAPRAMVANKPTAER